MTKRSYKRRSDDQLIEDLESKIKQVEARMQARERKDSPVLKEIPKVKKRLAAFAQLCMDHHRKDLSNTVMGFLTMLDIQAKDVPDEARPSAPRRERADNGESGSADEDDRADERDFSMGENVA